LALIKFSLTSKGLHVLALHPIHQQAPFFNLDANSAFEVTYEMNTDHDIFGLKVGDVTLTDLTKYPFTIDPEIYDGIPTLLENQEKLKKDGTLIIFHGGSNEVNL
jgi:hypothetical protein